MKKIFLLFFLSFICLLSSHAQYLAGFSDYKNYYYIFNEGALQQLETMPVEKTFSNQNAVFYENNLSELWAYYDDEKILLSSVYSKLHVKDFLATYELANILYVFQNGTNMMLTKYFESYKTGDEMVAFIEKNNELFKVFFNGEVTILEDIAEGIHIESYQLNDNLLAYTTDQDYFKMFYNNELTEISSSAEKIIYSVGKNTLAFWDDMALEFAVYQNGEKFFLESNKPVSFSAGDNLVAYINNYEEFKVFFNENEYLISSFQPEFYEVIDELVIYTEQGYFKVFCNGKIYTLESYMPNYEANMNKILYLDAAKNLIFFDNGNVLSITNEEVNSFILSGSLPVFETGINKTKFFFNGKIY